MRFLLGRYEKSASEFYPEYVKNNELFANEPLKNMSRLTHNLLKGIDYNNIRNKRTESFTELHRLFSGINELFIIIPDGAFMYPLLINNGHEVRKKLQAKRVYIPLLWPNVLNINGVGSNDIKMAMDILPLPCDQRYIKEDIDYMTEVIIECLH